MIIVELAGEPRGKGRPRFVRKTGVAFTPAATRSYEAALRYAAQEAMAGRTPLAGPLGVKVEAFMPIPKSWPKKKQAAALAGDIWPTTRPDWENLAKTLDSFNEVVWKDDAQVVSGFIVKFYSDRPRLRIEVRPLECIGGTDAAARA